jgi:anti-sigma factor RsiW
MNGKSSHPVDFSPYVDRDLTDSRYEEIRAHIQECGRCRDEVKNWQSLDGVFRSADQISVPPFQWQRIAAALQPEPRAAFFPGLRALLNFRKPAWSMALATMVLAVAVWTGLVYRKNNEQSQVLIAISQYQLVGDSKLGQEENPFQIPQVTNHTNESNPFAVRR